MSSSTSSSGKTSHPCSRVSLANLCQVPWNPFLGLPNSTQLHHPGYSINDQVRLSPTSTQSLTITHMAFNPSTQRFIYALRISGPRNRNALDTLHITASEELLHKLPDLVADYRGTDDDEEEDEERAPRSGSSKRQRLCQQHYQEQPQSQSQSRSRPQPSPSSFSTSSAATKAIPRKAIWICGTETKIKIGDRAKANDGTHHWEGTIRSLPDRGHGWFTATTRNSTVRAFGPGHVLIKREGWVNE